MTHYKEMSAGYEELHREEQLHKLKLIKQGLTELEEVFDFLQSFEKTDNVVADVSLARGLAYYTGTVFEVYAKGSEITSSIYSYMLYDRILR